MSWIPITCQESDALHAAHDLHVAVGFTDMDGEYGDPEIRREWSDRATDELVVKDICYLPHPNTGDRKPCEHYAFEATA